MLRTKVLGEPRRTSSYPSALDVGCGPGLVMEYFISLLDVKGIDIDPEMVERARGRGMDAVQGDALELPYKNGSFDIVYCSFTLLWVKDPQRALMEMARVSKRYVICFAEPDYGGRVCHPKEVADLGPYLISSLQDEGADPFVGRKIGHMMEKAGLEVEMGVHAGVWSPTQLKVEAKGEWDSIAHQVEGKIGKTGLGRAKAAWDASLADGSLFLYNPIFYAIGRKF